MHATSIYEETQISLTIYRMAVANIMMIAYGHSPDENSDDLINMAQEVMQYLGTAMTTHKHLVDALPFCSYHLSLS